jgi:hypothetical protein
LPDARSLAVRRGRDVACVSAFTCVAGGAGEGGDPAGCWIAGPRSIRWHLPEIKAYRGA